MVLANVLSNLTVSSKIHTTYEITYTLAAQACNFDGDQVCKVHAFTWTKETIYALPTLLFSFECHGTMLPIYCDLRRKEPIKLFQARVNCMASVTLLIFIRSL